MKFGGKMTKEVKEQILKYSDWEYKEHQFKTVAERKQREKYLIEFRKKIKWYVDGVHTLVSEKSLSDVYANHGPFDFNSNMMMNTSISLSNNIRDLNRKISIKYIAKS